MVDTLFLTIFGHINATGRATDGSKDYMFDVPHPHFGPLMVAEFVLPDSPQVTGNFRCEVSFIKDNRIRTIDIVWPKLENITYQDGQFKHEIVTTLAHRSAWWTFRLFGQDGKIFLRSVNVSLDKLRYKYPIDSILSNEEAMYIQ